MPTVVKRKLKKKNFFKLLGLLIILPILFISIIDFISWKKDTSEIKKELSKIHSSIKVKNLVDDNRTTVIEPSVEISKFDRYYNYINMSLIDVDFSALQKINSDTIGFIEIKGTDISLPIVFKEDTTYYQTHSFLKKENRFGWPQLISKYNKDFDDITIIESTNETLKDIKSLFKKEWQQNKNNHIIKFVTKDYTSLWQIIGINKSKENKQLNTNDIVSNSLYDFKTFITNEDKILILKAYTGKTNYYVYAKLIKYKTN